MMRSIARTYPPPCPQFSSFHKYNLVLASLPSPQLWEPANKACSQLLSTRPCLGQRRRTCSLRGVLIADPYVGHYPMLSPPRQA